MAVAKETRFVIVMSSAMALSMLGLSIQPALLPVFFAEWSLSETEAGWLNGIFFAGYVAGVPVLMTITDHIDARRVYLVSSAVSFIALMAFALFAEGFWSGLLLRALGGLGFAGTYMPGLKTLTDRIDRRSSSRAVSFYTASFGLGTALSFLLAGELNAALDWRWASGLTAMGAAMAMILVFVAIPPRQPVRQANSLGLFDFRPVFRNKVAVSYIFSYALHSWELMVVSSWMVAFLTYSASLQAGGVSWNVTLIAALAALASMPASIVGNELAQKFGRRQTISTVMFLSAGLGCVIGFSAGLPFGLVIFLCLAYGALVAADSASVTAGTVISATPEHHGATMAMHSFIGFGGAFVGPMAFGLVLDLAGGRQSTNAWGTAFAVIALTTLLGPVLLKYYARDDDAPSD